MRPSAKFLFALLAIFVIVSGQLFGVAAGYICKCHDAPMLTSASHCHDTPTSSHQDHHHHQDAPASSHDPSDAHQLNRDSLEVSPLNKLPSAPHPSSIALALPHFHTCWLPQLTTHLVEKSPENWRSCHASPAVPTATIVAISTVILV